MLPASSPLKKYLTPAVGLWGGILLISAALVGVYFAARGALLQSAVESEGQQIEVLARVVMAHTEEVIAHADSIARYVQTRWRQTDRIEVKHLAESGERAQGAIMQVVMSDATWSQRS